MRRIVLCALFVLSVVVQTTNSASIKLVGTARDFWPCESLNKCGTLGVSNVQCGQCNEDFERYNGDDRGMVESMLDTSGGYRRPKLKSGTQKSISKKEKFEYWYTDKPGHNIPLPVELELRNDICGKPNCDPNVYQYFSSDFFPINNRGYGNFPSGNDKSRNFHFTFMLSTNFTYRGNEVFTFDGDDDVWVFVNNRLIVDLGGVHSAQTQTVNLNSSAAASSMTKGQTYPFDIFFAERHTTASNFRVTTSIVMECDQKDWCGVCGGNGQSCCQCNDGNACTIDTCDPKTGACIFTPVDCSSRNNACQTSTCNPSTGQCVDTPIVICPEPGPCQNPGTCNPSNGQCTYTNKNNGATCDDGDLCTQSSTCKNGVCQGSNPKTCNSPGQCEKKPGTCNPATGQCEYELLADGTSCDDGNSCTSGEKCQAGVCTGGTGTVCVSEDGCKIPKGCSKGKCQFDNVLLGACKHLDSCVTGGTCLVGNCIGATTINCPAPPKCHYKSGCSNGQCIFSPVDDGTECDDGDSCTVNDKCTNGVCSGEPKPCPHSGNPCKGPGVCVNGKCQEPNLLDGTECEYVGPGDDHCYEPGTCKNGECKASKINCVPNQCQANPKCEKSTGQCTFRDLDGTGCNDGDKCTTNDRCDGDVCRGTPVVCDNTNLPPCREPRQCNPQNGISFSVINQLNFSGQCEAAISPDGTACDNGDPCAAVMQCQSGVCVTKQNKDCGSSPDQCKLDGVCDRLTGDCYFPNKPDATVCNDNNACTVNDRCQSGSCSSSPLVCPEPSPDSCTILLPCDSATGCKYGNKENGASCSDGNACTINDSCMDGVCVGEEVVCPDPEQCKVRGTCNPATGICSTPNAEDGSGCSLNDNCTLSSVCTGGVCTGRLFITCAPPDQCHEAGVCDSKTGECQYNPKPNGTPCTDQDPCTLGDTCQSGVCVGTLLTCPAAPTCHAPGVCNSNTGTCTYAPLNNTVCDDGNACTLEDRCSKGVCVGSNPVECPTPSNPCKVAGTCNPETGICVPENAENGTPCDDNNACTNTDTCQDGTCTGSDWTVCDTPPSQCHSSSGFCTPTGECYYPLREDGSGCDDGNPCTINDFCTGGTCRGIDIVCEAPDQCHQFGVCNVETGKCEYANVENGQTCNDGNACTQVDECQDGVCVGTDPVICTAKDQCHQAGECDVITGVCSNPQKPDGTSCDDGDACSNGSTCQAGVCEGNNWVVCTATSQCHLPGVCNSTTGVCSTPTRPAGRRCDDSDGCTLDDRCDGEGHCVGEPVVCAPNDQCHQPGFCDKGTGKCLYFELPDGTTCNDGNACTQQDSCQSGECIGFNEVVCKDLDDCHLPGVCDTTTGECTYEKQPDGTACDDGNLCSLTSVCTDGVCGGDSWLVCSTPGQCYGDGSCDEETGNCVFPFLPEGTRCNDGNACTHHDKCNGEGVCIGTDKVCPENDQCHEPGVCDPATGTCSYANVEQFTPCNDGNLCTTTDYCYNGACIGEDKVVCEALDQCHVPGICDPSTGTCSNPVAPDGTGCILDDNCAVTAACSSGECVATEVVACADPDQCHTNGVCNPENGTCSYIFTYLKACDDGDPCTEYDACSGATEKCVGKPIKCPPPDQCHKQGVCNSANGECEYEPLADGTVCDDGNACTQEDTCQAGVCTGSDPVVCVALDQCHVAGTCDPATGKCSEPAAEDGTSCDDQNACSQESQCFGGDCVGLNWIVCQALDQCHVPGTCNNVTGACSNPIKENATPCNDHNKCTENDQCTEGVCAGTEITCPAPDQCHEAATCDLASGACVFPQKADGTSCDDGNACTQTDECHAGVCVGSNSVVCAALDECHIAGTCDPSTGVCSNPEAPNGTICTDDDLCSTSSECQSGVCTGVTFKDCAPRQCHESGVCLPTGECQIVNKPDGTLCDDNSNSTNNDRCQDGVCVGTFVECPERDQCHAAGVYDPITDQCVYEPVPNGTPCRDGDKCTLSDSCQDGVCVGTPVDCPTTAVACHTVPVCDAETGTCVSEVLPDGTECDDGDVCTSASVCSAGVCVATAKLECNTPGQCQYGRGYCNAEMGGCVYRAIPDGVTCEDGNLCTVNDFCVAGECVAEPKVCDSPDQCHTGGSCNEDTGLCEYTPLEDGTVCDDENACSETSVCISGVCTGSNFRNGTCPPPNGCHDEGVCDEVTGLCNAVAKPDGTACTIRDSCVTATCQSGLCTVEVNKVCTAISQCHAAGLCNSIEGKCVNVPLTGSTCDDSNSCTVNDRCENGACVGTPIPGCDPIEVDGPSPPYILLTERTGEIYQTQTLWLSFFFFGLTNLPEFKVKVTNYPNGGTERYTFGFVTYPSDREYTMLYKQELLRNRDKDFVAVKFNPPQHQKVEDITLEIEVAYTRQSGIKGLGYHTITVPVIASVGDFVINSADSVVQVESGRSTWFAVSFSAIARLLDFEVTFESDSGLIFSYPNGNDYSSFYMHSFINYGETDFAAIRVTAPSSVNPGTVNAFMTVKWLGDSPRNQTFPVSITVLPEAEAFTVRKRQAEPDVTLTTQKVVIYANQTTWVALNLEAGPSKIDQVTVSASGSGVTVGHSSSATESTVGTILARQSNFAALELKALTAGDYNIQVNVSYVKSGVAYWEIFPVGVAVLPTEFVLQMNDFRVPAGETTTISLPFQLPDVLTSDIGVSIVSGSAGIGIVQLDSDSEGKSSWFVLLEVSVDKSVPTGNYAFTLEFQYNTPLTGEVKVTRSVVFRVTGVPQDEQSDDDSQSSGPNGGNSGSAAPEDDVIEESSSATPGWAVGLGVGLGVGLFVVIGLIVGVMVLIYYQRKRNSTVYVFKQPAAPENFKF